LNDAAVSPAPRAGWLWYFAYGSNMNPQRLFDARLARDGVPWGRRVAGRLDGWRLAFNKPWSRFPGAGVANIVPDAAARVFGTLNEMPPEGLDVLDRFEGVAGGHYARRNVAVRIGDADVAAVTYVADGGLADGLRPACSYLAHLLAGNDLLPGDYVRALAAQNCLEVQERDA
jgi:gamma-glutamylcyclotransferase (GGCT)/AIG2-like uncharacterized protein YtfP